MIPDKYPNGYYLLDEVQGNVIQWLKHFINSIFCLRNCDAKFIFTMLTNGVDQKNIQIQDLQIEEFQMLHRYHFVELWNIQLDQVLGLSFLFKSQY